MRDEGLYLDDILEAARAIRQFLSDVTLDEFLDSDLLQSAVVQKLTIIGEAATRLSDSTREKYPEIKWRSIKGFRNIAVHVYYELDWDLVWETATVQVEELAPQIATIIEHDFPMADDSVEDS